MDGKFIRNMLLKAVVLFVAANLLITELNLGAAAGKLSLYNHLVPGRERFPYGEIPAQSYNVSVYNLDALFAAHEIAGQPKADDEYRVVLIGDSSIWGTLLRPEETLAGQLAGSDLRVPAGKHARFFNLGYPTMSTLKDLLILERVPQYQPDLIVWSVTLESLAQVNQVNSPLVQNNLALARRLNQTYGLGLDLPQDASSAGWLARSIFGQRRALSDLVRLQMYGFLWAATGQDQYYPPVYALALRDFEQDRGFYDFTAPLQSKDLALRALQAGMRIAGETPILLVNEPILISTGTNADVRYNFYYPRWAYDDYRALLAETAAANGWLYLDAWDMVAESEFTNTAVHLSPYGVGQELAVIQAVLPDVVAHGRVPSRGELAEWLGADPGMNFTVAAQEEPAENTSQPGPIISAATATPSATSTGSAPIATLNPTPVGAGSGVRSVPTSGACYPPEQWQEMPVTPAYVSEQAIEIYQRGLTNGTQANVFSVIGDCQNVPTVFLGPFDNPKQYNLGADYAYLQPVIDHFAGSFNVKGLARRGGLNVAAVLSPLRADPKLCEKNETPVQCELRVHNPSIVIVSLEEWWSKSSMETYEGYLRQVLDEIIAHGALPILSTKADNLEGDHGINQTIAKLACEYQIPLWNFWAAAQPLPSQGLWSDGFHLTVGQFDYTHPKNLNAGRSIRNLTALQALDVVWRAVNGMAMGK